MATVLAAFSILKDHVKLKVSQDYVAIDNIVFKLHYRATFLALLTATVLVSSRQFVGEHIRCIADMSIPPHVLDTFCFFMSTYTVVRHNNLTAVNDGLVAHPGVGPSTEEDPLTYHAYYQWVPFVLFAQAIFFYLPHQLWKSKEGGRLKVLVTGLHLTSLSLRNEALIVNDETIIPSYDEYQEKLRIIRTAFLNRVHVNRPWAYYLSMCEILNFVNVIAQIYITDRFLGGAFLGLGSEVTEANFDGKVNVLDIVFPKVTKCAFHKYGPSGSIQKHDALCIMALNVVNEKIYTFLWFWLIILAIVTGLSLVWRIITLLLHSRSKKFNQIVFAMACPGRNSPWSVLQVTRKYSFSDWLFLYYVAKNLDNYVFKELFEKLAKDLEDQEDQADQAYRKPLPPLPPLPRNDMEEHTLLPTKSLKETSLA